MEFVSPVIVHVLQSMMRPIKKHLGFYVSSTKNVKEMDDKMKKLEDMAREVQYQWDTAVVNIEVVPERVEPWLKDVISLNERSNLIEATGSCFNVIKRYKVGKQSYAILEEIKDLESRESKIMFTHAQRPLAEVGSTSAGPSTSALVPMGNQLDFGSRNLIFNNVLRALQSDDESQKMIALCGMGGVGKTTMMKQLKKVVEDSKMFDWVVMVVIGENPNVISLQKAIAQYIGKDLNEIDKYASAERLRKMFEEKSQKGQKKNLVIMDDIWNEVDLSLVGLSPLPHGFKLLFTSRFEDVCNRMGVGTCSIFKIHVLSTQEAKALFSTTVEPCPWDVDDVELQKIGDEVVIKCGGLPIAIVTIAKLLRGNIKEKWKEALYNLEHHDLQDLDEIVNKVFEMSYNNLKKEDDKAVFLLSGLFPDGTDIPIEGMMIIGWGLNLFTKVRTLAQARRRANICVNNLIRANLLTESDRKGCYKMHDLVRAFVLSNFSKVKQASIFNQHDMLKEANESYQRIFMNCTDMFDVPMDFNYPNLSLLILVDGKNLKFREDMFDRMKQLKVVIYMDLKIPSLPVILKHSTELRTLCLQSCSLINNDISFLGSLCNLEILSFYDCNIKWLPLELSKLKKLKCLGLTKCGDLCVEDGVFKNLTNLEELYVESSRFSDDTCDKVENLSQSLFVLELDFFTNKLVQPKNVSFKKLEKFRISIGRSREYDEDDSLENTLDLKGDLNELLECKISELFEKVEILYLQVNDIIQLQDVSAHHIFSSLRELEVSNCKDLTYLFSVDVASGLKKLERLQVSGCDVLTSLVGGEDSGASSKVIIRFEKLKYMSLKSLPKMVCLSENIVIELPEMMKLILVNLPNFSSIYPDNSTSETQTLLNKKVVIAKLEKLKINEMTNLKQIWSCHIEKNNVSMLRKITVKSCHSLTNVFPYNPLPLLNHLEEVDVHDCDSIQVLFNIEFDTVSGMWECNSSGIELTSIEVSDSKKFKEVWRMRGVNNSDILLINGGFKGVDSIKIRNCGRFTNVFTPITTSFEVRSLYIENNEQIDDTYPSYLLDTYHHLQRLVLSSDARMKGVLFELDSPLFLYVLPTIEFIKLDGLKEMSHVWKCNWNQVLVPQHQPFLNLTEIYLEDCCKIKYLFSPLMVKFLSKLKNVRIRKCSYIEEVISNRDDENITTSSHHQNTAFFPCLDTLSLEYLDDLKRIDGGHLQSGQIIGACWSMCQYPTDIDIEHCNGLSSLVPWYAVGQMEKLQTLEIRDCKKMKEVFESNNASDGVMLTLENHITTVVVPRLSNLKEVYVYKCDLVQHIFTFSTLESLNQLQVLNVQKCKGIQVVIEKEENGIMSSKDVVFRCLETLVLEDLPSLKGFFLGKNDGPHWFMSQSGIALIDDVYIWSPPKLEYIKTSLGRHLLECDLNFCGTINQYEYQTTFLTSSDPTISKGMPSFHNLIEMKVHKNNIETAIFPSKALLQLEKLQMVDVGDCDTVEEVFEVVALERSGFNESQLTVVKIPNLTQVKLRYLHNLKYLWKSNQLMVLEFPNLTKVSIKSCPSLEHVFTCSMVGSLVQLQDLKISECKNIEIIVKEKECDDGKVNNEIIMLPLLKTIQTSKSQGTFLRERRFLISSSKYFRNQGMPNNYSFHQRRFVYTSPECNKYNFWVVCCKGGSQRLSKDQTRREYKGGSCWWEQPLDQKGGWLEGEELCFLHITDLCACYGFCHARTAIKKLSFFSF